MSRICCFDFWACSYNETHDGATHLQSLPEPAAAGCAVANVEETKMIGADSRCVREAVKQAAKDGVKLHDRRYQMHRAQEFFDLNYILVVNDSRSGTDQHVGWFPPKWPLQSAWEDCGIGKRK